MAAGAAVQVLDGIEEKRIDPGIVGRAKGTDALRREDEPRRFAKHDLPAAEVERPQRAFSAKRLNGKFQNRRDHCAEQVGALVEDLLTLPVRDQAPVAALDD